MLYREWCYTILKVNIYKLFIYLQISLSKQFHSSDLDNIIPLKTWHYLSINNQLGTKLGYPYRKVSNWFHIVY